MVSLTLSVGMVGICRVSLPYNELEDLLNYALRGIDSRFQSSPFNGLFLTFNYYGNWVQTIAACDRSDSAMQGSV